MDYLTNDTDLTTVADAIREKGGTSAALAFPQGFADAIAAIPSGGGIELKFLRATLDDYDYVTVDMVFVKLGESPIIEGQDLWFVFGSAFAGWVSTDSALYDVPIIEMPEGLPDNILFSDSHAVTPECMFGINVASDGETTAENMTVQVTYSKSNDVGYPLTSFCGYLRY